MKNYYSIKCKISLLTFFVFGSLANVALAQNLDNNFNPCDWTGRMKHIQPATPITWTTFPCTTWLDQSGTTSGYERIQYLSRDYSFKAGHRYLIYFSGCLFNPERYPRMIISASTGFSNGFLNQQIIKYYTEGCETSAIFEPTMDYSLVVLNLEIWSNTTASAGVSSIKILEDPCENSNATITGSVNGVICSGNSITVNPSAVTGPYQSRPKAIKWSNGSGAASIVPTTSGTYSALISDNTGCISNVSLNVTINDVNPGTIAASQTVCFGGTPQPLTGAASGSGALSYQWQQRNVGGAWGDISGEINEAFIPPVSVVNIKEYRRKTKSTFNGKQCEKLGNELSVTVNPLPANGSISASASSICMGQSVTISSTGGNGTPYYWATTDGVTWNVFEQQYGGQSSFNFTPEQPGTYTFYVYRQNSCGFCWDTNSCSSWPGVTVTVNPRPINGTITASATSICVGDVVTISSTGGNGPPSYWASSDGIQTWNIFAQGHSGEYSFPFSPSQPGTYYIFMYNQNSCGFCWWNNTCNGSDPAVQIVVNPKPSDPYISRTYDICTYGYTILTAYSSNATSYKWNTEETSQSIQADPNNGYSVYAINGSCTSNSSYLYINPCSQYCYDEWGNAIFCDPFRKRKDGSTEETTLDEQTMLGIYPNPANNEVTVEVPVKAETNLEVQMISQIGHLVMGSSIPIGGVRTILDTKNVPDGVYIVLIKSKLGTMLTQKVIIKH